MSIWINILPTFVVTICFYLLNAIPPSSVLRGRPIPAGNNLLMCSNNYLVLLSCLWTNYLCVKISWESMAAPIDSVTTGPSGWIPALVICLFIYFIYFFYIISTTINISMLNIHKFEFDVSTYFPALVAGLCDDVASKSTCYCPLTPQPNYSSRFSFYYISKYNFCSVLFTQPFTNIVKYVTTYNSWWSIRVDPFYNWTIRVVPYLSVS